MNRLVNRMLVLLVLITGFTSFSWSQDLIVNNEVNGFTNFTFRDTTAELRVQVRLSSAQTLEGIMPTLVPPACAVYQGAPLFSTTYVGYVNGASVVEGAFPSLVQNNNATFVFLVHYFAGDDTICDTGTSPCTDNTYDFSLTYTHSGSTQSILANANNQLSFGGAIDGGYSIVNRISTSGRGPNSCTRINNSIVTPMPFEGIDVAVLNDDASRILVGIDWDAHLDTLPQGWLEALDVYDVPISNSSHINMYDLVALRGLEMVDPGTVEDPTVIVDIDSNFQYNLAQILGGDGEPLGPNDPDCNKQFWNFFDVTDFRSTTNVIIKDNASAWTNEFLNIDRGSQLIHHRETALFQAYPNECSMRDGLGANFRDMKFNSLVFKSDQTVDVQIEVPSEWEASPGILTNDFSIEWFYRNNDTLGPASVVTGTSRQTSVTLLVPFSSPDQYRIEARITRNTSAEIDPVVSFVSDKHDLSYLETGAELFFNAEVNGAGGSQPDVYLDAGEIMVKPIRISNTGSETLTNVVVELGSNNDGVEFAFGASEDSSRAQVFTGTLAAGQDVDLDFSVLLISSLLDCQDVELFYEVSYTNSQGFQTSFTDTFSVTVNCEEVEQAYAIDGTWTAEECFGDPNPCQDSNCSNSTVICDPSTDWSYSTLLDSWTGASTVNSKYYELRSPIFPVGFNGRFDMRHLPAFVFRLAGGIVEYRNCTSGANCNDADWADFILPLESSSGNTYYNGSSFPALDNFQDQIISDRRVFQDVSVPQDISQNIPSNLFTQDFVQFRLVFQVRELTGTGSWTVENFTYTSFQPLEDNLFGLPSVNLAPCPQPFTLEPEVSGNYQFEFYTSIDDLREGNAPHTINSTGDWAYPIPLTSTTYYALVRDLDTGVERIWPMTANNDQEVPPFAPCADAWDGSFDEACDLNSDTKLNMLDLVAQRNGDLCVTR